MNPSNLASRYATPSRLAETSRASIQLLLVGQSSSPAIHQAADDATTRGWQVRHEEDAFAANEQIATSPSPLAVLLDYESFQPKTAALARSLLSARPEANIWLLCPAHLEGEVLRTVSATPALRYVVSPLTAADWREIAQRLDRQAAPEPASPPPRGERLSETDQLAQFNRLLDCLNQPLDKLLQSCAQWASGLLGGVPARVEWSGKSADHPAAPTTPATPYTLLDGTQQPAGRLIVQSADSGAVSQTARAVNRVLMFRQRMTAFRQMAFTDHLSGAHNRRYLTLFLDQLISRAEREGFRITLLMFDIDDFKKYNDAYGFSVGDEIIVDIARLMRQCSRPHDVVARLGGDEYAVLIWDSGPPRQPGSQHPHEARAVAERFRKALASHEFKSIGPSAQGVLTISGGLATYPGDGASADALIRVASQRFRLAKKSGKNQIYVVGTPQ